jgi:hypothetical protein
LIDECASGAPAHQNEGRLIAQPAFRFQIRNSLYARLANGPRSN